MFVESTGKKGSKSKKLLSIFYRIMSLNKYIYGESIHMNVCKHFRATIAFLEKPTQCGRRRFKILSGEDNCCEFIWRFTQVHTFYLEQKELNA